MVESAPRQAAFGGYTVLARGDDLDDVLATMAAAALLDARRSAAATRARPAAWSRRCVASDRRAETTNVVAVDADGNVCAITTSLGLGSGVWVPGFGVHLNSHDRRGRADPGHAPSPGTGLGSMMSPLVALDAERRPAGRSAGAAGGSRIRPALVQSVLRMLPGRRRSPRSTSRG